MGVEVRDLPVGLVAEFQLGWDKDGCSLLEEVVLSSPFRVKEGDIG